MLLRFDECTLCTLSKATGPELVGGTSGESEERIRRIFENAAAAAPSVLFIDALDVIAGKKDAVCICIYYVTYVGGNSVCVTICNILSWLSTSLLCVVFTL